MAHPTQQPHPRIELAPCSPSVDLTATLHGSGCLTFVERGPRGGYYTVSVPHDELPKLLAFLAAELPAIKALAAYAADAPDMAHGEGFWDDQESACGDGMRQERSDAAALIRTALKALGIEPPEGIAVCDECYLPLADGHHYQCSRDGEEEEEKEEAAA